MVGMKRSAKEHGMEIEILEPDEIRRRWPQFQPRDNMVGAYDPRTQVSCSRKSVSHRILNKPRSKALTCTTTSR